MKSAVSSIRNLGPSMEAACGRAGIDCAQTLRRLGTDAAYARLLAAGEKPHFIAYYALEMALQGRPWNDCKGAEKDLLRARFDALKAQHSHSHTRIEAMLNTIGVMPARQVQR